jgi:hypothetical protein
VKVKLTARLASFLLLIALCPSPCHAQRCDNLGTKVTCKTLPKSGNLVVDDCIIEKPDVCHPRTQYPQITIAQGDVVDVQAWGCAQTGGKGLTWKDFVSPKGVDSDHLYFGQIWLKTDMGSKADIFPLRRFAPHSENLEFKVPVGAHSEVWVGYVDNHYDDNGYWNHDAGNPEQCNGTDEAWVDIHIVRSGLAALPPFSTSGPAPVDTTISVNLPAIQAGEGPAVFGESWPPLPGTVATLVKLRNPNQFSLDVLKPNRPSANCFSDPSSVVHLAPGQSTTDMQSLYNNMKPPLPVTILTCIENAASIPSIVPIEVTYEHAP